jgi:hypothetical protein
MPGCSGGEDAHMESAQEGPEPLASTIPQEMATLEARMGGGRVDTLCATLQGLLVQLAAMGDSAPQSGTPLCFCN